ncbi:TIGR02265 family protein [Cystobacter ferrugineus]|uniref:TIGR02265 family protein n=1 Tax=Cystobacter ferrugineus TaxID=83449 RepID=A0A1L9B2B0_9BACT|nr:TIGR02265 family protein [Cystobacter ferrugineus]OJH36384.1 hypothetical protein BON30_31915 [Cystobacter ferrugineus]
MMTSACAVDVGPVRVDASEELAQRLALSIPGDTVRGSLFLGTLDAVRTWAGEAAMLRCVDAGGEPRFKEFFNYPLGAFIRVNAAAAWELAPGCGGWDAAQRLLGQRAATDLLASAAGKALLLLSRCETRRLVGNLPSAYRAAMNHGERSVSWEGFCRGRVTMRRDFMPCAFHEGLLRAVLESTKAREVEVVGSRVDVLDSEYVLSWQ